MSQVTRMLVTEELGRFEELFSDVVYPVWPVWLAGLVVTAALAALLAYRKGWHRWALQHRLFTGGALAIVLAVGIPAGWYTISPLFERETVCEASPIAGAGAGSEKCAGVAMAAFGSISTATPAPTTAPVATSAATQPPQFQPRVASQGEFRGADDFHFGRGQALLIETAPGEYTLRFENFSVRNGPDLFVYLSTDPGGISDALLLGDLKGTDGAFNYDVPAGTDVSRFKSAVVWCRQFAVLFAAATFA
jgi:hypothetical protein